MSQQGLHNVLRYASWGIRSQNFLSKPLHVCVCECVCDAHVFQLAFAIYTTSTHPHHSSVRTAAMFQIPSLCVHSSLSARQQDYRALHPHAHCVCVCVRVCVRGVTLACRWPKPLARKPDRICSTFGPPRFQRSMFRVHNPVLQANTRHFYHKPRHKHVPS